MQGQHRPSPNPRWRALIRMRPSPAMVVAVIALLVALSGSAIAVNQLEEDQAAEELGRLEQIQKGAVEEVGSGEEGRRQEAHRMTMR